MVQVLVHEAQRIKKWILWAVVICLNETASIWIQSTRRRNYYSKGSRRKKAKEQKGYDDPMIWQNVNVFKWVNKDTYHWLIFKILNLLIKYLILGFFKRFILHIYSCHDQIIRNPCSKKKKKFNYPPWVEHLVKARGVRSQLIKPAWLIDFQK